MTSAATPSRAPTERFARLQRLGGWMATLGLAAAAASSAALVALGGGVSLSRLTAGTALVPFPALLVLVALGVMVGTAGLALYVVVPGLDPALARRDVGSPRTIVACLAAVFIIGNVLPLPAFFISGWWIDAQGSAGRALATPALPFPVLMLSLFVTQLSLMAVLIWRVVRPGAITWEDMGLTAAHLDRRMLQGLVGGLGILFLSGVVGLMMRQFGVEQTQASLFAAVRDIGPTQFMGFWLMVSVVAPICEECFFRGYVFGALRGRYGRAAAYAGSAVVFAAIHFNLPAIVPILIMASGLAFMYDRTGSVVPGIIAHGFNNSVALMALYAGFSG